MVDVQEEHGTNAELSGTDAELDLRIYPFNIGFLNMIVSLSRLKNLPVFTQSGLHLGHVSDLEIDTESQSVLRYLVQRGRLVGCWQKPLLIHRQQVLSISKDKMIVEDVVVKEAVESERKRVAVPEVAASGVSARQLDN